MTCAKPTEYWSEIDSDQLQSLRREWVERFRNPDGSVTAWTAVPAVALEQLHQQGFLTCQTSLIDEDYATAYPWMCERMHEAGLVAPTSGISPLWCWIQAGHAGRKPAMELLEGADFLLEIRLEADQLLCSDFDYWHFALNYWPLTRSESASDAFEAELQAHGLCPYRTKPLPAPHHERIQASWRQIFMHDFRMDDEPAVPFEERMVQGVFWKLNLDQLVVTEAIR